MGKKICTASTGRKADKKYAKRCMEWQPRPCSVPKKVKPRKTSLWQAIKKWWAETRSLERAMWEGLWK